MKSSPYIRNCVALDTGMCATCRKVSIFVSANYYILDNDASMNTIINTSAYCQMNPPKAFILTYTPLFASPIENRKGRKKIL